MKDGKLVFKTTINELKKAIKMLSPIVNHTHSVLAFRYVMIRYNKDRDKIEIKGYDDYTIGSVFVSCYDKEGEDQKVYVLAKQFFNLINSFGSGEVTFNITDKCVILKDKSRYTISVLDSNVASEALDHVDFDYYTIEQGKSNVKIDAFNAAYRAIEHCLSKDDSQRSLQNVFLKDGKMIACDTIRGAVINFPVVLDNFMVHKKACDCISNCNSNDIYLGYLEDKLLLGQSDNFIFVSTLSDEYPYDSFKEIINSFYKDPVEKSGFKTVIKIDPDEISEKLNRVLMFANSDTNAVQVLVDKGEMLLKVEDQTEAKETINVFEDLGSTSINLYVDGKNLRESLSKSLTGTKWFTNGEEEIQYIYDGNLLQFFLGLSL